MVLKFQSQVRAIYGIPRGWGGTCTPQSITDHITDQKTPYCDELRYTVSNDIRMLEENQRRAKETNSLRVHHSSSDLSSLLIDNTLITFL